jgi:hypothetical protein
MSDTEKVAVSTPSRITDYFPPSPNPKEIGKYLFNNS